MGEICLKYLPTVIRRMILTILRMNLALNLTIFRQILMRIHRAQATLLLRVPVPGLTRLPGRGATQPGVAARGTRGRGVR